MSIRSTVLLALFVIGFASLTSAQSTLAGGGAFTLVVKSDGTLWAFGLNNNGQLGDNSVMTRKTPQQIGGLSSIQAVAAGSLHSMALTTGGALYVWGDNFYGQVGDASTTDRKTPVLLTLSNVVAIAAGEFHSLALTSNGNVYAWGRNNFGQIGNGGATTTNVTTPTLVLSGAAAIGAGRNHSLAVKSDGTAWAWGANGSGQLGNNTTSTGATSLPVQMQGITTASKIAGGEAHSLLILSDGILKGAGENGAGQLADTTSTDRWTVITIGSLSNVAQVVSGLDHVFARLTDGTVWGWGENSGGELGLGPSNLTDKNAPVQIAALSGIASMATGWNHSISVDSNGVVSTWGANASSQLGDGTAIARPTPTPISDTAYAWRVATPTFNPTSGTFNADKPVVVSVDTTGATIHYTQNGADPTESDPIVTAGGSITVAYSQTIKAKGWKSGMPAGEVAIATILMQVATPTVSPAVGTYATAQNVTFSTTTPGAILRYTTDLSDPTESSTAYSGAINVAHTTTFRIAGFKSGWSPSAVKAAPYTMNFGTLAAPSVDPATGPYTGSVSVTMSSPQSGATIHYTTGNPNTTAPTAASPTYSAAIPVSATTTIRAKVFHLDYATSGETSRTYTLTTHTPTLNTVAGSYAPGSTVTITAGEPSDTLRMTIDGTDPTTTSPTIASGTTLLLGNFTLKVKAWRMGAADSAIANAAYTLNGPLGPGSAAAGGTHSVIATPDGRVIAWGANASGQLGIESTTTKTTPTTLNTITGVIAVSGGLAHTLAVTYDRQVYAWGNNGSGRLGDGTTTQRTKPTLITTLSNIISVAAGDSHSLALTSDGHVYAWGSNASGELGLGNTTATSTPTLIATLSNIVAIAVGDAHSLAVTSSGQLYAWGNNGSSRLGDGTTTNPTSPTLINLSNALSVAGGAAYSIALTSSGAVYAWGLNTNGQLGLGNTTLKSTPTQIPSLHASAIAAGDTHSAALRGDGVLVSWGVNTSGQLGDTTLTQRTSPVVVSSPTSVSSLAFGDAHSVAVTPDGDVWTWGAGTSGQLGDGATANRSTPQAAITTIANWVPSAPTLSLASGSYASAQNITITSPITGAVVRYTLTGSDPSDNDAEITSGSVLTVEYSALLRVRAFASGRLAGQIARADYELQSGAPIINPPTGTYTAAQTVSITAGGPPSVIRYTTDGSDPTSASTGYSQPFEVSTTQTLKARAFPLNGWPASSASSAVLTFNYGEVSAPTPSVAGGVFPDGQTISFSTDAGSIIRYTTDGTDPTSVSNLYVSPISVATGTVVVKSRAFRTDWTPSTTRTDSYTIDTIGPTISSTTFPGSSGSWFNTPTTVSFICVDNVGLASCTAPATVSTEGTSQQVVGTAIDMAGRQTQLPVAVSIDLTAPQLSLTAPTAPLSTTDTSIAISATVSDSLSGVASVSCNEVTATLTSGQADCTVALAPGRNDIALVARDLAGNSKSTGIRVTRTGTSTLLTLSPSSMHVAIDETISLALNDDFGVAISTATWTSSDDTIVSVSSDDPPVITAVAAGTATITATKNGLSADATIAVINGPVIPDGETRWSLSPLPGLGAWMLGANRTDVTVPDMYTLESDGISESYIVRGVTAAGQVTSTTQAPGYPLMADSFGGIVSVTGWHSMNSLYGLDNRNAGYARFGGPEGTVPWRYTSIDSVGAPAQASDGTIYFLERFQVGTNTYQQRPIIETQLVVLDGATGIVRGRYTLPRELRNASGSIWQAIPETLGPIVGNDGYGYVLVRGQQRTENGARDVSVTLYRVSPSVAVTQTSIYSQHCEGPWPYTVCDQAPTLRELVPDGLGGMLARAEYTTAAVPCSCSGNVQYPIETRLARVLDEAMQYQVVTSNGEQIMWVGDGGRAYAHASPLRAVDVTNWTTIWSTGSDSWGMVVPAANGAVAIHEVNTDQLTLFDSTGAQTASTTFGGAWGYQFAFGLWTTVDNNGQLSARFSLPVDEATQSYSPGGGSQSLQNAPRNRIHKTRESAALLALDYIYPIGEQSQWEYGALICAVGEGFEWSRFVTDQNQSSVNVQDSLCPTGALRAHLHTHPTKEPSGAPTNPADFDKADAHPGIPYYLRGKRPNSNGLMTVKYWNGASRAAVDNLCLLEGTVQSPTWIPYSPGSTAVCLTPLP